MSESFRQRKPGFPTDLSRRSFLAGGVAAGVAIGSQGLMAPATAFSAGKDSPYAEFKMGIQSYSLRGFDTPTALKHTRKLGLKFWEAYPRHVPLGTLPAHIAKQKAILAKSGIKLTAPS